MRSDEFISLLCANAEKQGWETLKKGVPLGLDASENTVFAQKDGRTLTVRRTCVTGSGKNAFLRRTLYTLSCLYEKEQACFFVLSPHTEYGELLRLKNMDVTVPYVRTKEDFLLALETVKELIRQRETGRGYPYLILILDGLEDLPDCNVNGDLEEYRTVFDLFTRRDQAEVLVGVDLLKSIFSGYPATFVGEGNCLVSLREEGKADVTYVKEDGSMSLPVPIRYPSEPSATETVIFLNSFAKNTGRDERF